MEMQESTRITIGEQAITPITEEMAGLQPHLANTTAFILLGALESAKGSRCGAEWTWLLQRLRGDCQEDAY